MSDNTQRQLLATLLRHIPRAPATREVVEMIEALGPVGLKLLMNVMAAWHAAEAKAATATSDEQGRFDAYFNVVNHLYDHTDEIGCPAFNQTESDVLRSLLDVQGIPV